MEENDTYMTVGLITQALTCAGGGGGSGARLQHGSFTENGMYFPDQGYDGFDQVEVAVPEVLPPHYYEAYVHDSTQYDISGMVALNDGFTVDYVFGVDPYSLNTPVASGGVMRTQFRNKVIKVQIPYSMVYYLKYHGTVISTYRQSIGLEGHEWLDATHLKWHRTLDSITSPIFYGYPRSMVTVIRYGQTLALVAETNGKAVFTDYDDEHGTSTTTEVTIGSLQQVGFGMSDLSPQQFVEFIEANYDDWTIA